MPTLSELRYNPFLEIDIVEFCSLSCFNCNRSCATHQAPSSRFMSIDIINDLIDQSTSLKWRWKKIRILGGEPTLHPFLFDILKLLQGYSVVLVTNGYNDKTKLVLKEIQDFYPWIGIENTNKSSNINPDFNSFNVAPIDIPSFFDSDFSVGCMLPECCGYGLGISGFYPCCVAAGIDRVFGFNVQQTSLQNLDKQWFYSTCQKLCRFCGHFYHQKFPYDLKSKSWIQAYQKYANKSKMEQENNDDTRNV